jgi:hypothetical protein
MIKRGRVCVGPMTVTAMDECLHGLAELTIRSRARKSGVVPRRCILASWICRVSLRGLDACSEVGIIRPIGCPPGYRSISGLILDKVDMMQEGVIKGRIPHWRYESRPLIHDNRVAHGHLHLRLGWRSHTRVS